MAIEFNRTELRSHQIKKKKQKQQLVVVVSLCIIILIGFIFFLSYQILNKNYTSYEIVHTTERNDSISAKYVPYGTGILRYSRDGAMAMDGAGNLLWNGTYEMKEPYVDICEKYVVISDIGSKELYIFNGQGKMTLITVLHPIMKSVISGQGVVAVLMEGDKVNYIELYSEENSTSPLVETQTRKIEDGFPMDLDISVDGRKLVTSFLTVKQGATQSVVTFYNYGDVGQNYTDKIVGGFDYGETLVPDVEFVNNNTVAVLGDNKLNIISMKEIPKLVYEEDIIEEINSVVYNEEFVGYITNNQEGEEKYRVKVIDTLGNKVLDKAINYNYNKVYLSGNEIVFYSDLEWNILKLNGKLKLNYVFENNIVFISSVNDFDKYIVVDSYNMLEVKLVEKSKEY